MIVAAWAEHADGPGWRNSVVWYLVRDANGKLRIECLQPEEQTPEMVTLFNVSEAASNGMVAAVERATLACKKKRVKP